MENVMGKNKETIKKGDVVEFEYEILGGKGIGVITEETPYGGGFFEILLNEKVSNYRQHFKKIRKIKDLNVFDMIKEKIK